MEQFINYKEQAFDQVLSPSSVDYIFDVLGGDMLIRSIALKPKKVVSTSFPNVDKLHKTGINMPTWLTWIMRIASSKFTKAARRNGVQLIGQVTGANGQLLQEAADHVKRQQYIVRPFSTLTLKEVAAQGLEGSPVGTVLQF